ncbi:MAG: hypothetical protein IJ418_16195 [Clostridia bacterium]|nr:hypothetical protein [Clostridia bacterium]
MAGTLYAKSLPVSGSISIMVPSVGEIYDNEDQYYDAVSTIVATPYDMMVQLDDAGIDFTQINDYELFCLLFPRLKSMDTRLLFGDLNISNFQTAIDEKDGKIFLVDPETDIRIDRIVHDQMCRQLRKMLHLTKEVKIPGNEDAKKYMLDRARRKQRRRKDKRPDSQIENYIVALVNTEQFPYNYETVREISILQFYASLNQIAHKIKFDNTMVGFYAGTIKLEDLKAEERTWIQNV